MVYLSTLEDWQRQSSLLLQARPATTRITTKYNIPNLHTPRYSVDKKRKRETETENKDAAPRVPRGTLTLKAYDPESGVTLKFKTDRSQDVGRMIAGLGRAGRYMAALPEKAEALDVATEDAPSGTGTPAVEKVEVAKDTAPAAQTEAKPTTASKKKKKGKK